MLTTRSVPSRIALIVVATAAALGTPALAGSPTRAPRKMGTTFSHVELRNRGIDPIAAFEAMGELGLRVIRLGAYWTEIEPKEGTFDFRALDDLLARAHARRQEVLLTVGMKAPRWPEFWIPAWARPTGEHAKKNAEVSRDATLRRRALKFITTVVRHCERAPAITAWQVENEPMDRSGPDRWFLGADYVQAVARAIRANDRAHRPLVVNLWCDDQVYGSWPWTDSTYAERNALETGDVVGLDVYPRVGKEQLFYARRTIGLPTRYRAAALRDGKDAWIVESQAEPWAPSNVDAAAMRWLVDRHDEQGYRVVFLWGFEHWYELRTKKRDPGFWNAVKDVVSKWQAKA